MKYTVCRYESRLDGGIRYGTAVFPGFVGPRSPDIQKFFTRTRPEHGVHSWRVRLLDFDGAPRPFRETYAYWTRCSDCGLAANARKRALYRGPLDAEVVFVGEAPGQDEDRVGLPFIGRSGVFLDALIESAGYNADEVLIANPVLCRPVGPSGKDRRPTLSEVGACVKHLRELLDIVRPRAVVLVGATARDTFTDEKPKWEGLFSLGVPTKFALIHHPSWFLRSGGTTAREYDRARVTLLQVRRKVGAARKRVRPLTDWSRVLWPSVERAIKHCKADKVFKGAE